MKIKAFKVAKKRTFRGKNKWESEDGKPARKNHDYWRNVVQEAKRLINLKESFDPPFSQKSLI